MWSSSFFFNDTATTEIYTLSLHDALPISARRLAAPSRRASRAPPRRGRVRRRRGRARRRSEEHTSELQSLTNLVCRLLLEKKKKTCAPGLRGSDARRERRRRAARRRPAVG